MLLTASFVPQLPKRTSKKKDSDSTTERPFNRMAVSALTVGLSWRDLQHIKYTHLMQLLWEWEDLHGAEVDETRDATPQDVMNLMRI